MNFRESWDSFKQNTKILFLDFSYQVEYFWAFCSKKIYFFLLFFKGYLNLIFGSFFLLGLGFFLFFFYSYVLFFSCICIVFFYCLPLIFSFNLFKPWRSKYNRKVKQFWSLWDDYRASIIFFFDYKYVYFRKSLVLRIGFFLFSCCLLIILFYFYFSYSPILKDFERWVIELCFGP